MYNYMQKKGQVVYYVALWPPDDGVPSCCEMRPEMRRSGEMHEEREGRENNDGRENTYDKGQSGEKIGEKERKCVCDHRK